MKILSVFFLVFITTLSWCQTVNKDSIIERVRTKYSHNFSKDICNDYLELAERKIKNDSLIIPRHKFIPRLSETFNRWVKKEFNLIEWHYGNGCVILPGTTCFDEYMFAAIEEKFGKGFFERQIKITDSLYRIGLGYIEPVFPGSDDSLRKLIYAKINVYKLVESSPNGPRALAIDIDKTGKVTEVILFEGSVVMFAVDKQDKLQKKLNELFKNLPQWTPAKFLGEPIESSYYYPLHP